MRRPPLLTPTAVLALALAVAACDKAGAQTAAATPAASPAPVQWDYASKDPAKNPDAANKESTVPGYMP